MRNAHMKIYLKSVLISSVVGVAVSLSACSNASSADQVTAAAPDIETVGSNANANVSGNWDIQPDSSHIRFSAKQEGEPFTGEFQSFSGVINFDPAAPETGFVEITIPLSSVDAGSNDRNSTLPGKIWFSAKKFPSAIFTSSNITAVDGAYIAKGDLSLKGTSVPVSLPFSLDIKGEVAVMSSSLTIDRTLWNVGAEPWNTDEWVSRDVQLEIQVTANRSE